MSVNRREQLWIASCALLAFGVAIQTIALRRAEAHLRSEKDKPFWPDRLQPLSADAANDRRFEPSTGRVIPAAFWGEFAEDVHDCGGEGTMLVKKDEILFPDDERQRIETVRWKEPQRIELETRGGLYSRASFGMLLSDDRDEITLVYTNVKRIVQRCSTRSHEASDTAANSGDAAVAMTNGTDSALSLNDSDDVTEAVD
jgi:hypothetical protein